ncbi:MAG: RNA polymerase II C-terminal domain kinase beta subunit [Geoglossum umbratile]|nr:MAG: RNA polymerase II C-terminal domain kinase beta subunit [Geoglossum umbratile]
MNSPTSRPDCSTGPHPSFIHVAKPYVFEHEIRQHTAATGVSEAKEDSMRLLGIAWIDSVRKALQLPVRTYNTAAVYYHKFRLVHADIEYSFLDAAAAALFTACKIEDTLKKSREILCAAYNLRLAQADHLSPDDSHFESHSKAIIGLERLMLEASGFDFRNRYPQKVLIKLAKLYNFDKETAAKTAYNMCCDLYRTFAPLKQTTLTMAFACLELSARLWGIQIENPQGKDGFDYERWSTTREEVMDLLDLYTHHRATTIVGQNYSLDTFIAIRITLNQEASAGNYHRYTEWVGEKKLNSNGTKASPATPDRDSASENREGGNRRHRLSPPMRPTSATEARGRPSERRRDGTVRFMLDPERARRENVAVADYFKSEEGVMEIEYDGGGRRR